MDTIESRIEKTIKLLEIMRGSKFHNAVVNNKIISLTKKLDELYLEQASKKQTKEN